jgi:hypothetical protein
MTTFEGSRLSTVSIRGRTGCAVAVIPLPEADMGE